MTEDAMNSKIFYQVVDEFLGAFYSDYCEPRGEEFDTLDEAIEYADKHKYDHACNENYVCSIISAYRRTEDGRVEVVADFDTCGHPTWVARGYEDLFTRKEEADESAPA